MSRSPSRRTVGNLGEFEIIRLLHHAIAQSSLPPPHGIGDDSAVIPPTPGYEWLVSKDLLIEGIHFDRNLSSHRDIGYKAAAVNVSDIAAMGGIPHYLLVGLAIPPSTTVVDIRSLYRGLNALCKKYEIKLIGGDTCASRTDLCISLTIIGKVKSGQALRRGGAKAGDLIYVTGTLGDSGAGLRLLRRPSQQITRQLSKSVVGFLIKRHLHPTPQVSLGRLLSERRIATSAIDLSDGLSGDIRHICQASHVGAVIYAQQIPISRPCATYMNHCQESPMNLALHSGEDYELLFTIPPKQRQQLERMARSLDQKISLIGSIKHERQKIYIQQADGTCELLSKQSYDHFHQ